MENIEKRFRQNCIVDKNIFKGEKIMIKSIFLKTYKGF